MKIAVSIPDPIFAEVENLAAQMKMSRSSLYARALGEFVGRHGPDRLTKSMNDALAEIDDAPDIARKTAARKVFDAVEW